MDFCHVLTVAMESDGQGTGEVLPTLLATLCLRVGRHLSYLLVRIHKISSNHASSVSLSPDESISAHHA